MTMSRLIRSAAIAAALCLAGTGCSSTTAPSETNSHIAELVFSLQTYAGTLDVGGSGFYSIVVSQEGPVSLTLAAVQTPGGGALTTPLGIGIGVPSGTTCKRSTSQSAAPSLAAQLTTTLIPGTYCVAVYDAGALTSAVNFAMRIRYP
jgi:hypothetical protein